MEIVFAMRVERLVFLAPCLATQVRLPRLTGLVQRVADYRFFFNLFSLKETLVFVEALCDSSSDVPSSLRVRSLVETEPESRYSRMLNRGRFTEAESLAKLYDLDLKVPTLN